MSLQEQTERLPVNIKDSSANFPDLLSLVVHRLAAERLREKPKLLETAKTNLRNWLNANPNIPAWLE